MIVLYAYIQSLKFLLRKFLFMSEISENAQVMKNILRFIINKM
jgi:hypothetical protein